MFDIAYVFWHIWKMRSGMVVARKSVDCHSATLRIKMDVKEFYQLNEDLNKDEKSNFKEKSQDK